MVLHQAVGFGSNVDTSGIVQPVGMAANLQNEAEPICLSAQLKITSGVVDLAARGTLQQVQYLNVHKEAPLMVFILSNIMCPDGEEVRKLPYGLSPSASVWRFLLFNTPYSAVISCSQMLVTIT